MRDIHRTFIIAEAGVNHNGNLELAKKLIDAAAQAQADAVKFQTFKTENLLVPAAPKAQYQRQTTGGSESQWEMLRGLELSHRAHGELLAYCRQKNILFLSTPFDEESADFLDSLGVTRFKLPSGEITNIPFLRHVAGKRKPIILSTGMSYLEEVRDAVNAIVAEGHRDITLLHCVSSYPAPFAELNLKAMETLKKEFALPVGLSDHSPGTEAALAAVALGAVMIEKHLTLDRNLPGPDHRASLEPHEFEALVAGIRRVESALGDGIKEPQPSEMDTRNVARKSLVARCDIPSGTRLEPHMLVVKRPGTGFAPKEIIRFLGKTSRRSIVKDEIISPELFIS